jgi:hypothetical protein
MYLAIMTTKIFQCRDERWRAGVQHDLSALLRRARRRRWWIQAERMHAKTMINERKSAYNRTAIREAIELIVSQKEVGFYGRDGLCLKGGGLISCSGRCCENAIDPDHTDWRNNAMVAVLLEGHSSYGYNDSDDCRCWDDQCVRTVNNDMNSVAEICNDIVGVCHKGHF